jgi:hypothetical protein
MGNRILIESGLDPIKESSEAFSRIRKTEIRMNAYASFPIILAELLSSQ